MRSLVLAVLFFAGDVSACSSDITHEGLGEAYSRLTAWLNEHGREQAGAACEVYWWIDASREPDPSRWPPPTEWRTEHVQQIVATE